MFILSQTFLPRETPHVFVGRILRWDFSGVLNGEGPVTVRVRAAS